MKYIRLLLLFLTAPIAVYSLENGFYYPEPTFFSDWECSPRDYVQLDTEWTVDLLAGYTMGRYIGLEENYFQIGSTAYSPTVKSTQPVFDVRAYRLDDGHWASSLGAGVRWTNCEQDQIWGANLFYDYRATDIGSFNRIGLGAEWFTSGLDYRFNLYLPLQSERTKDHHHYLFTKAFKSEHLYVPGGFDFLVSKCLWVGKTFEVEGTAGPYYYYNKNIDHIFGLQVGVDIAVTKYVALDVCLTFDNKFKANAQGSILFILPLTDVLCCEPADDCRPQILDPFRRNGVIFNAKHNESWK